MTNGHAQIIKNVVTTNVNSQEQDKQIQEIKNFLEGLPERKPISIPPELAKKMLDTGIFSNVAKHLLSRNNMNKRIANEYLDYLSKNNNFDDAVEFYNAIKPKQKTIDLDVPSHIVFREDYNAGNIKVKNTDVVPELIEEQNKIVDIGTGKNIWNTYERIYLSSMREDLGIRENIVNQSYNEKFYGELEETLRSLRTNNLLSEKAKRLFILTVAELNYVHNDLSIQYLKSVRKFSNLVKNNQELFEDGLEEFLVQTGLITTPLFRSEAQTPGRTFLNRLYAYRHLNNGISKFGNLSSDDISSMGRVALWDSLIQSKPAQEAPHLFLRRNPLDERTRLIDPDSRRQRTKFILSPLSDLEYYMNPLGFMSSGRINPGNNRRYDGSASLGGIKLPDDLSRNFNSIGNYFNYGLYPVMTTELDVRLPYESWELSQYKIKDAVKKCFIMKERIHEWRVDRGYGGAGGGGVKDTEGNLRTPLFGGAISLSGREIDYTKVISNEILIEKYSEIEYGGEKYKLAMVNGEIQTDSNKLPLYNKVTSEGESNVGKTDTLSLQQVIDYGIIPLDFSDMKVPFGLEASGEETQEGYFGGGSVWAADLGPVADITNMLYAQERKDKEMELLGTALMNLGPEKIPNQTLFFVKGFEIEDDDGNTKGSGLGKAYFVQDERIYEIRAGRNDFIDMLNFYSLKINEDAANLTIEGSYQDKTDTGGFVTAVDIGRFASLFQFQKVPQRMTYKDENQETEYYQFTLGGSLRDVNLFLREKGRSETSLSIPLDLITINQLGETRVITDSDKDEDKVKRVPTGEGKEGFKTGFIFIETTEDSRLRISFQGGKVKDTKYSEQGEISVPGRREFEVSEDIVIDTGGIFDSKGERIDQYSLGVRFNTGNSNFDDLANAQEEMYEYLNEFYRVSLLASGMKKEEFGGIWATTILPVFQFNKVINEEGKEELDVQGLFRLMGAYRHLKGQGISVDFSRATQFDRLLSEYEQFRESYISGESMNQKDLDKDIEDFNARFNELSSILYTGSVVSTFDERGSGLSMNFEWYEKDKQPEDVGFYFVKNFDSGFIRGYTNLKSDLTSTTDSEGEKLLTLSSGAGFGFDIKETSRLVFDGGFTAALIRSEVLDETPPRESFFGRILVRYNDNSRKRTYLAEEFNSFTQLYTSYNQGKVNNTSDVRETAFIRQLKESTGESLNEILKMRPEELGPHIKKALSARNREIVESIYEPVFSAGILYSRDLQNDLNVLELQLMVEKFETMQAFLISRKTIPDVSSEYEGAAFEFAAGYTRFINERLRFISETGVRISTLKNKEREVDMERPLGLYQTISIGNENVQFYGQFNNEWVKFNDIFEKMNTDTKRAWSFFIGFTFSF